MYYDIFKDTRYKIKVAEIHIRNKILHTLINIYLFIYIRYNKKRI